MGERLGIDTLAADPLVFFSEPVTKLKLNLPSHNSCPLCSPSTGSPGELMQMRFYVISWCFKKAYESLAHSSIFLLLRISTDSHSQMLCGHLLPALCSGLGIPSSDETPCTSGGTSAAEMSLHILSCSLWEQGQLFLCPRPAYLSPCGLFYKSMVTGLLFG